MERWYVLTVKPKQEEESAALLERVVESRYWSFLRIPRKVKVFRSGGAIHLLNDVMFPGYVFVKTAYPEKLEKELWKSIELPNFINCERENARKRIRKNIEKDKIEAIFSTQEALVPVEKKDLAFLQHVCGRNLQSVMGVTSIILDEDNRIIQANGVLEGYLDRIIKMNLHKRFAVVEIPLFNRIQPILFGLRLPQDQAV